MGIGAEPSALTDGFQVKRGQATARFKSVETVSKRFKPFQIG
jgi:hypothetical protein